MIKFVTPDKKVVYYPLHAVHSIFLNDDNKIMAYVTRRDSAKLIPMQIETFSTVPEGETIFKIHFTNACP